MNDNLEIQKQLAHFINFHHFSFPDTPNTIEGIITSGDIKDDLSRVMQLLKKEYIFIDYQKSQDSFDFMISLSDLLNSGKIVFLFMIEPVLHPIVYDQFMCLRDDNHYNILVSEKLGRINLKPVSENAHIFLVFTVDKETKPDDRMYDLTDHLLDLREKGQ